MAGVVGYDGGDGNDDGDYNDGDDCNDEGDGAMMVAMATTATVGQRRWQCGHDAPGTRGNLQFG